MKPSDHGLRDYALPARLEATLEVNSGATLAAQPARRGHLTPELLSQVVKRLTATGASTLRQLGHQRLLAVWSATVEAFRDPASEERRQLDPTLAAHCQLSPAGLNGALQAVLQGVAGRPAATLWQRAADWEPAGGDSAPAWVVLASNLPALAVQPLLSALVTARAVVLKSPSAEPFFAAQFVRALCAREGALQDALVALTWRGGDRTLEAPLLAGCDPIVAYGETATLADLERRASGHLVGYGPKTSLAIVSHEADPALAARGLARDIALFDQRGCLSVAAVYTDGAASTLATELAIALRHQASELPPGPTDLAAASALQQLRGEAQMRGLESHLLALNTGTVLVEPKLNFQPSPGLRTVRVHPVDRLTSIPALLSPWRGRLQGAALAGAAAWELTEPLRGLGFSRFANPGELQLADASWRNTAPLLEALRQPANGE